MASVEEVVGNDKLCYNVQHLGDDGMVDKVIQHEDVPHQKQQQQYQEEGGEIEDDWKEDETVQYRVDQSPPVYMCLLLGLQVSFPQQGN